MINNSVGTRSKISIAKCIDWKNGPKKVQDPTFWHFPAIFLQFADSKMTPQLSCTAGLPCWLMQQLLLTQHPCKAVMVPVKRTSRALHPPSASFSPRPRQNTHQPADFLSQPPDWILHLGTGHVKNCQPWTCGTPGDRPEENCLHWPNFCSKKVREKPWKTAF